MGKYENYSPEIYDDEDNGRYLGFQGDNIDPDNNIVSENQKQQIAVNTKNKSVKKTIRNEKRPDSKLIKVRRFFVSPGMRIFLGSFLGITAAWLLIALISFLKTGLADQSVVETTSGSVVEVQNIAGEGGARVSQSLVNDYFGIGSIIIIFWLLSLSIKLFGIKYLSLNFVGFTIKCLLVLIVTSLIMGLLTIGLDLDMFWGGCHGLYINKLIIGYFGEIGSILICLLIIMTFLALCINDLREWWKKRREKIALRRAEQEALKAAEAKKIRERETLLKIEEEEVQNENVNSSSSEIEAEQSRENLVFEEDDMALDNAFESVDEVEVDNLYYNASEEADNGVNQKENSDNSNSGSEPESTMIVNVNNIEDVVGDTEQPETYDPTAELSNYKFPPYELLNDVKTKISVDKEEQSANKEKIERTLSSFDIPIVSIEATVGPTVSLYEIVPDKGVRIAKIRNLVDDIALRLAAIGVRIIAPIPGKGTVGIEVANKDPQTVSMRTVITSKKYQESKYELPIALGSTISNDVYITDLAKMPHLLVAGATGQGKSVGLNAIITSLLYRKHPAELKFVLVDPKMVEFSLYSRIERQYLAKLPDEDEPIITDPQKVVATLSSLCVEMDNRYSLLKDANVRNIKEYNAKFIKKVLNPEKGHRYLPYIVVIVDEFSDLIMMAGKEVETPIARIAQKARAVGIHMIIATQRPSTNVITGVIKANFPARMAFKVSSGVDSKTILDTTGAQQLIGRGDMLVSNNSEMDRVQCAFIDTPEVNQICEFISSQPGYNTAYLLPEPPADSGSTNGNGSDSSSMNERDVLFEEAARMIVVSNTASTSSLQRRYSIGYNRAGKIMDQMEAAGIVGPAQGGKPRTVLVDSMTLETILNG